MKSKLFFFFLSTLFLAFLTLPLALSGCSWADTVTIPKPAPYKGNIEPVSSFAVLTYVEQISAEHGVKASILLEDGDYFVPEHRWVADLFGQWLPSAISALNLQYNAESWDCDDYSDFAVMGARIALADKKARVTIARISLEPDTPDGQRHQIVAFLSDQGLYFVEPQPHNGFVRIWPPGRGELQRIYQINLRNSEVVISS